MSETPLNKSKTYGKDVDLPTPDRRGKKHGCGIKPDQSGTLQTDETQKDSKPVHHGSPSGTRGKTPDLDDVLNLEEFSEWIGMHPKRVAPKCKGSRPAIPCIWLNQRTVRFHPRMVLAKWASEAGLSTALIQAAFGMENTH